MEREARPEPDGARSAGFAEVAGLTAAAALGACLVLIPLGYFLLPVVALPDPFPDHHQRAETLVFVLAFAAVLPLAVAIVPRLADRVAAVSAGALSGIAALSCAAMAAALPAVKVSEWLPWGDGLGTLLAAMVLWWALTAGLVAGVISGRWIAPLERIGRRRRILWSATTALVVVVMPAFAFLDSISIVGLLVSVLLALVCLAAYVRGGRPVPGGWGKALDVAAVVLLFLVVPNLVIIRPDVPAEAFDTQVIQFHQNFYLGPAGHVLGGGTMLVDTLSQYGVASIDFIAGWLAIVGTSNGMLGLLDGITSALVFVGGYLVVRAAGVGRAMSAVGFLVAVLVLVLALVFPVGALLQHGAIRFGMPMVVLVAAAARLRSERWAGPARAAEILAVGLSSIWALEAFAYTVLTYAAIVAAESVLLPAGERRGHALRLTAAAVAACIVTHVLFAAATLISSGSLPEWGLYLGTLYEFLAGGISDLTYDFSAWSPGIAVGAAYLVSAVRVCVLIARERERAIAGRTAGRPARGDHRLRGRALQLPGQPLGRPHRPLREPAAGDGGADLAGIARAGRGVPACSHGRGRGRPRRFGAVDRGGVVLDRSSLLAVGTRPRGARRRVDDGRDRPPPRHAGDPPGSGRGRAPARRVLAGRERGAGDRRARSRSRGAGANREGERAAAE
ncbi:MAG: hypothetical protein R2700_15670 [Solirubrobacterales bacterium]